MTVMTEAPASAKQLEFLKDLVDSRQLNAEEREYLTDRIARETLSKVAASKHIDALLKLPKAAKPKAATKSPMQELLASAPKSKYAIPVAELEFSDADDEFRGDLVFIEIKEYMQTLYMRQLHGAPGRFNRSKLSSKSVKAIVEIIATDPYKYTKIFGDHYTCCGSCGAELTDQRSRELMLGPECRKKFGY